MSLSREPDTTRDLEYERWREDIRKEICRRQWVAFALGIFKAPLPQVNHADTVAVAVRRYAALREKAIELGLLEAQPEEPRS